MLFELDIKALWLNWLYVEKQTFNLVQEHIQQSGMEKYDV